MAEQRKTAFAKTDSTSVGKTLDAGRLESFQRTVFHNNADLLRATTPAALHPYLEPWLQAGQTWLDFWFGGSSNTPTPKTEHSAGTENYKFVKRATMAWMLQTPPQYRPYIRYFLIDNPATSQMLNTGNMATIMDAVGDWYGGKDALQARNGQFVTHNKDGSLNETLPSQVTQLFDPKTPQKWPNLVLTCTHALAGEDADLSQIMKGMHALTRHLYGKPLSLARHVQPGKDYAGKAIMLAASHTEDNAWKNGAAMIRRYNTLKERDPDVPSAQDWQDIAPHAQRLALLMLSALVTEPERVDVSQPDATIAALQRADAPLTLRLDAARVAQHFTLMGYSKGGNVVTDAVRYLVHCLQSEQDAGLGLVRVDGQAAGAAAPSQAVISNIVKNVGLLSIAAGEVPLSEREKAFGMRRTTIINDKDIIAGHFRAGQEDAFGQHDDFYLVKGTGRRGGHDPDHALGVDDKIGYIVGNDTFPSDPRVIDRLKVLFAPMYKRTAIADVAFMPAEDDKPAHLLLERGPGIADAAFAKRIPEIERALQKAGVAGARLECRGGESGVCEIKADIDVLEDPVAINALKRGFEQLKAQAKGLFISEQVFAEIDRHCDRLMPGNKVHEVDAGTRHVLRAGRAHGEGAGLGSGS
ncbi:MAG: hypothetical protein CMM94_02985 [Rickettsiales bacterium]|nr:hypothetical protein [Rickettsiales bacterium]